MAAMLAFGACANKELAPLHIVPQPRSIEMGEGALTLKGVTVCCDPSFDDKAFTAVESFARQLSLVTGKESAVSGDDGALSFVKDDSIVPE